MGEDYMERTLYREKIILYREGTIWGGHKYEKGIYKEELDRKRVI